MKGNSSYFLASILNCRINDVTLLDNITYDSDVINEIIDNCWYRRDFSLDSVLGETYLKGMGDIFNEIKSRIGDLKFKGQPLSESEEQELEELSELYPYDDFEYLPRNANTNVYLQEHGDIYLKYLGCALDEFQKDTGFKLFY